MSITIEHLSRRDIMKLFDRRLESHIKFVVGEIEKLRNRMNDIESLIKIYDGRLKLVAKNKK